MLGASIMPRNLQAPAKCRLDHLLVKRGLFPDLRCAQAWIINGKIVVDEKVISKLGFSIHHDAKVLIRGYRLAYASRGGYKLARALNRFDLSVQGAICLDAGASAGGFTDCLLQRGASFVYAVETGYGQLRGRLAGDPRVRNLERINLSDVKRTALEPAINMAVADLSYLSLRTAIPLIKDLFSSEDYRILFLIKPLYEGLQQGSVGDVDAIHEVLRRLFTDLLEEGIGLRDACVSPITGGRGAVEFFAWADAQAPTVSALELAHRAILEASSAPPLAFEDYISRIPIELTPSVCD